MGATLRALILYRGVPRLLRLLEILENTLPGRMLPPDVPPAPPAGRLPVHLYISHGRGGGADKFTREQMAACEAKNEPAHLLTFNVLRRCFVLDGKPFWRATTLLKALQTLGVSRMHIQQMQFFPFAFIQSLPRFAAALGAPYDMMLHDYMPFCPRIHLIDARYHYCGMPQNPAACNRCLAESGMLTTAPADVAVWRAAWQRTLAGAQSVAALSRDAARRHGVFFPDVPIHVAPSPGGGELGARAPKHARARSGQECVVAVIGNIHVHKGADVLLACATDAKQRQLPLKFTVIGTCIRHAALAHQGVSVTGAYAAEALPALLKQSGAHAVFLPSTWPETYSYILNEVWQNGFFPVAFDLGAPAERIRDSGAGELLPAEWMDRPSDINNRLLALAA